MTDAGAGSHCRGMNGRQFIARVRKWARSRNLEVRFVASEGAGSHGTLYAGERRTTVKDRKKEILVIHESPLTDALFLLVSKSDEVTAT